MYFISKVLSLLILSLCSIVNAKSSSGTQGSTVISNGTASKPYWFESIKHQGVAAFRKDAKYQVFRNVKEFGAKGDGISDDTAAINLAISSGNRCGPKSCQSSTTSPAVVYFPGGTYSISAPIIDFYYTQIIGNPSDLPVIKATSNFTAFALIDGDQYQPGNAANPAGSLGFNSTNVFYRQIKNMVLDTTSAASNVSVNGIHWPSAQATSLQNIIFRLSDAPGTQHQGLFIEAGSGGFMSDLIFYGGLAGAFMGNQQFTSRNLSFYNSVQAINQIWDWGWTYKAITVSNCSVGLNMTSGGSSSQAVGSVTFIDSTITDTPIGILTSHDSATSSYSNGSLILENVLFKNVRMAVQGPNNSTALAGASGSKRVAAWGQGHQYTPTGPASFQGVIAEFIRPKGLSSGNDYYQRSKPSYATIPLSKFLSTRTHGARGDGITDDTAALQKVIDTASLSDQIVFFDAGTYRISKTLNVPRNSKLIGESYSSILSSGPLFANIHHPKPVVQIGQPGEVGSVEWSDMIVSTQGSQPGAVLIQWNLASVGEKSGMWDVHTRIGGFAGPHLQNADCPAPINSDASSNPNSNASAALSSSNTTTPFPPRNESSSASFPASWNTTSALPTPHNHTNTSSSCMGAFMSMHVTASATGLYMENNWLWTADHDLDSTLPKYANTNITVYAGRGLYIESQKGNIWLVGTAVEHHSLYQYQLVNTNNIFMGQIQTETPYYQPSAGQQQPFPAVKSLHDPPCGSSHAKGACEAWGLRIVDSTNVNVYGAGFTTPCQSNLLTLEGAHTSHINIYNLNTVGAKNMISRDGVSLA
ncbi:glycoside hydrolase family 55 protein [Usnea florida]